MLDEIEQRVASSARELFQGRVEIRENRLVLPAAPEGSDAPSALARACVQEAQATMQVSLPLRRAIKLVTDLVDRAERLESILKLVRDPFNSGVSVGADRVIRYWRFGVERFTSLQLADEQEALDIHERLAGARPRSAPSDRPAPVPAPAPDAPQVGLQWMVHRQLMSAEAADFLEKCIAARLNVVVSGELGAGRTTTVAALAALFPHDERVITVEETPEFALPLEHVVSLTLPRSGGRPRMAQRAPVTLRDLVRRTWRMRPDRIVLGEVRGEEIYDLLDSVRCTHASTLTSVSARSPHEAITRLEQLAQSAVPGMPARDVRDLVGDTVDVVVHQERLAGGLRRITSITEIHGMAGDELDVRMIFEREDGVLVACGTPSFGRLRHSPPEFTRPPPADLTGGPEEAGPVFRWTSQVAARVVNPLLARALAASGYRQAGSGNPSGERSERSEAEEVRIHDLLVKRIPAAPEVMAALGGTHDWRSLAKARVTVRTLLDTMLANQTGVGILPDARRKAIVDDVCNDLLGAGRIQSLLDDPAVTCIMINGPHQVMVESGGKVSKARLVYASDADVANLVDRYAPPPEFGVDALASSPGVSMDPPWMREGRLPDGTRLTAILPPASLIGPVVLLRKPST